MTNWNIWKGCCEFNEFCANCKVIKKGLTKFDVQIDDFDLPIHTKGIGELELKYPSYTIFNVCPLSDFFLENTDASREKYWNIMRLRHDCLFVICTKRVERLAERMPKEPLNNVAIVLSVSTQKELDYALAQEIPQSIKHLWVSVTPMKEEVSLAKLSNAKVANVSRIEYVYSGGDIFGETVTDFAWHSALAQECHDKEIGYTFQSTGTLFKIGEKVYTIPKDKQSEQATKANINVSKEVPIKELEGTPLMKGGFIWRVINNILVPLDENTREIKYDLLNQTQSIINYGKF